MCFEVINWSLEFDGIGVIADFCLSRLYSLITRSWLAVENSPSPTMALISSMLARSKPGCFSSADVTEFWRPRPFFLTGIIFRAHMRGVRYFYFTKNDRQKCFPKNILHSHKRVSRILCDLLYKYSLRLDRTYHHGVTFLGIFPCSFADRANVSLLCLFKLFSLSRLESSSPI